MAPSSEKRNPAGGPGFEGAVAGSEVQGDHTAARLGLLDFKAAAARRDRGMESSLQHANEELPGWSESAFHLLTQYAAQESMAWTAEQFRAWSHAQGLPPPPEARAFGPIVQRGLRAGLFVRVGYAPAASSNGSPKPTYARPALRVAA